MLTLIKMEVCTDHLQDRPVKAINMIWADTDLDDLLDTLEQCFNAAISNDDSAYDEGKHREQLILFYSFLHDLIIDMHWGKNKKSVPEKNLEAIKKLMEKYEIHYLRRELFDLIAAVIAYKGKLLECPRLMDMLHYYRWYSCFIEAAYKIISQPTPVHNLIPSGPEPSFS